MEKKYKLIWEYPGSPKLGSVITDTNPNSGAKDSWFDIKWCKANYRSFKLPLDLHPEKYPEFWEVVEPAITTEDGYVIKLDSNTQIYYVNNCFNLGSILSNCIEPHLINYKELIFFKFVKLAYSWIKHNKPKYSSKQIDDLKTKFCNDEFAYHLNIINEWETQQESAQKNNS